MNPREQDITGSHSALEPAGPQADHIDDALWIFNAVSAVVLCAVIALALIAVFRRRMRAGDRVDIVLEKNPAEERRLHGVIGAAAGLTLLTLIGLLVTSIVIGRALASIEDEGAVEIQVVGHQWWWQLTYPDADPSRTVTTANELHIPVGRPVRLVLQSRDVIHSFWVPALHGKLDLIPGRQNELVLRADRAGTFGGQCAEFCGLAHAKMALVVVAEPPHAFEAWLERSRRPAKQPSEPLAQRGKTVFLSTSCPMCHSINGTSAAATTGPDLTHFASRRGLGASSVPNARGHLAGWLLDPHGIKPGVYMPANALRSSELTALLAYLEILE